jgi:hypothetical protein
MQKKDYDQTQNRHFVPEEARRYLSELAFLLDFDSLLPCLLAIDIKHLFSPACFQRLL